MFKIAPQHCFGYTPLPVAKQKLLLSLHMIKVEMLGSVSSQTAHFGEAACPNLPKDV